MNEVTLIASAAWRNDDTRRQYIARVMGRGIKFDLALERIGEMTGTTTRAIVVEPGLYKTRDLDRAGNHEDTYIVVWRLDDLLVRTIVTEADALRLAGDLTPQNVEALGRRTAIEDTEAALLEASKEDPEEFTPVSHTMATELGINPGELRRKDVIVARLKHLHRMRAARHVLIARRDALRAQMRVIQAEIAAIVAELGSE
jgi:hypothetical protein